MTDERINEQFARALRQELTSVVRRHSRLRTRPSVRMSVITAVATALAGGGVAYAAGLFTLPGAASNTPLGTMTTATRTGTATIKLGPRPNGANDLSVSVTCLSPGNFSFPGGSLSCSTADVHAVSDRAWIVVPLLPRQHTVTVRAAPGAAWTLQAEYVHQVITRWGVNSHGQTYGVVNKNGTPDLVAVDIVHGHGSLQGYVKASDMNCAAGGDVTSPAQAVAWDKASAKRNISIPVYKSNGTSIIGTLIVGSASGPGVRTVPLSSLSWHCTAVLSARTG